MSAKRPSDDFLIWGRDVQEALHRGAEGDGRVNEEYIRRLPILAHHLAALYLIGAFSYLEGIKGPAPWRGTGVDEQHFEELKCIRDAATHNEGDIALNKDSSCRARISALGAIPGVSVNGSTVALGMAFTEEVRQSFLRLSRRFGLL